MNPVQGETGKFRDEDSGREPSERGHQDRGALAHNAGGLDAAALTPMQESPFMEQLRTFLGGPRRPIEELRENLRRTLSDVSGRATRLSPWDCERAALEQLANLGLGSREAIYTHGDEFVAVFQEQSARLAATDAHSLRRTVELLGNVTGELISIVGKAVLAEREPASAKAREPYEAARILEIAAQLNTKEEVIMPFSDSAVLVMPGDISARVTHAPFLAGATPAPLTDDQKRAEAVRIWGHAAHCLRHLVHRQYQIGEAELRGDAEVSAIVNPGRRAMALWAMGNLGNLERHVGSTVVGKRSDFGALQRAHDVMLTQLALFELDLPRDFRSAAQVVSNALVDHSPAELFGRQMKALGRCFENAAQLYLKLRDQDTAKQLLEVACRFPTASSFSKKALSQLQRRD